VVARTSPVINPIARDIRRVSRFLPTPPVFNAAVKGGGSPSEYCHDVWYGKTIEWCGYLMVKKLKICLVVYERDRQTDRRTDGPHDSIGIARQNTTATENDTTSLSYKPSAYGHWTD